MHTKNTYIFKLVLLISLTLCLSMVGANADSRSDNEAFSAAVKAVKVRDYSRALTLFEQQANNAKHDAQYNMAVLLQAGKGRPRNYLDALYWGWLAQLGGIEEAEDIASDILDKLTENDVKVVRARVGENLQSRIENGDINAISQFADYHLTILQEVKVHWIIDGVMEIDADTNEAAEALADEKLRGFINAHPELTKNLGATAIQGHAVTDRDDN